MGLCRNVEVKNLSKTGYGAYWLRKRFMQQVVENGYVNLRDPDYEYWLVFQGGLNSVGTPEEFSRLDSPACVYPCQRFTPALTSDGA